MKSEQEVLVGLLEALLDYDISETSAAWWGFLAFHDASVVIKPQLLKLSEVDEAIWKWQSGQALSEATLTL